MASSTVVSPLRLTATQLVCYRRTAVSRRSRSYLNFRFRYPKLVACTTSTGSAAETEKNASSQSEGVVEKTSAESQGETRTEEADGEAEAEAGDDEENLKLERGPSVEEAKQMAKYIGQVEAFTAPYRTKRWALTRNKGAQIGDLMIMYGGLLDRGFGSGQIMAAAGALVIEKIRKDANKLLGDEDVKEQDVYELLRAVQLLEMELQLVKVAKKGEKLFERLEKAKEHCKLAFKIASRI